MSKKTYDYHDVSIFPEEVSLTLPDGYRIDIDYDDDGNEESILKGGFYINEDGDEEYGFKCDFVKFNVNKTGEGDEETLKKLNDPSDPTFVFNQVVEGIMENLQEKFGAGKVLKLYNSSTPVALMKFHKPITLFGVILDTDIVFFLFEVNENTVFGITSIHQKDSTGSEQFYDQLYDVMQSVRVNDKPLDTRDITPQKIKNALSMEHDEDVEALDLGISIGLNVKIGDEETQFTMNSDGSVTEEKINTALEQVSPDESLYPHYNSMLKAQGFGLLGATVVINQTGTEYKFYQLKGELDDEEDLAEEYKAAISKLNDTGAATYTMADKSVEMRSLFHVYPSAFDPKHDRECELAEGYMHRAYMMSALRSFAWTLSNYCEDLSIEPENLSLAQIQKIIDVVADLNWLNYDEDSHCNSLCGTQDLHVYYLPDSTPGEVRSKFKPTQKQIEETKEMQEQWPNYNPILSQVGSLDGLRRDIEYIYPAIKTVYDDLKQNRNMEEPLLGNDADVLYAWCALAYAARGPFFSEDGPTMCFFTQMLSKEEQHEEIERERIEYGKKWMDSYGEYVEKKPAIEFQNKKFVFSGLGYRFHQMEDHTDYEKLIEEKGGVTRAGVSGVTDYLVVEPAGAGESKTEKAIEQQKNNKPIKIILLEDLRKALGLQIEHEWNTEIQTNDNVNRNPVANDNHYLEPSEAHSETVVVDDTWTIDVPAGYKYCTDKTIIGGHRNIIIMEDKEGNDFEEPFSASVSFTSMYNETENMPATMHAKMMINIMAGGKEKVLKDEDDLYVAYYFFDSVNDVGSKLDIFKIEIGCGNKESSVQVFFNDSPLSRREQHKLIVEVCNSINLKSPADSTNDTGWGQSITVDSPVTGSYGAEEALDSDSGWGSGITVNGNEMDEQHTEYRSTSKSSADDSIEENTDGWGSGITIEGETV